MQTTKLQEVNRKIVSKSFFITMPAEVARSLKAKKGDSFEWIIKGNDSVELKIIR